MYRVTYKGRESEKHSLHGCLVFITAKLSGTLAMEDITVKQAVEAGYKIVKA